MTNTHKVIAMLIAINMIIGIAMAVHNDIADIEETIMTAETGYMNEYEEKSESDEGMWGTVRANTDRQYDSTTGNTISMGWILASTLYRGINPLSIDANDFETEFEKSLANVLTFIRVLLSTLALLEVYMLLKNRKTS